MNESTAVSLTPRLIDAIVNIKNKKQLKALLKILAKGAVELKDLAESLQSGLSDTQRILEVLQQQKLIQRYASDNGETWYAIHSSILERCFECKGCEHNQRIKKNGYSLFKCTLGKTCFYDQFRIAYSVTNYLKAKGCREISTGVTVAKTIGEQKGESTKPVDEWNTNDFAIYLRVKYNKHWGHLFKLNLNITKRYCAKLRKAFVVEFGEKWAYALKNYIRYSVNTAIEKGDRLVIKAMTDISNMQKFATKKHVNLHEKCKKGVYCPYHCDGVCTLESQTCDDMFVDNIRRSYN
jgi:hypothetical protein